MASNINPYNVDGTFPIAGQDNPSQGFRDNFTNIKNNFLYAQNEITDLQGKTILSGALAGQTLNNDMAGTQITRPQLKAWTQSMIDLGTVSSSIVLDFNLANFQKITTAAPMTLGFQNWPSSVGAGSLGYGLMRVWIEVSDIAHTVTLPASVTVGAYDIAGFNSDTNAITFDQAVDPAVPGSGNYVFDFSSIDGGSNYLIFDVTRNRATFRDDNFYYNASATGVETLLVGYGSGRALAAQIEYGTDTFSTLGSYNSVAVGNLSLANVAYAQIDTGFVPGYSVTSARGNVYTNTSLTANNAVKGNDLIGYFNAYSYTGNGSANVFQLTSGITHFVTGSNVQYGLGGNIAFFVAPDGKPAVTAANYNTVQQAMSINNNMSINAYGNVTIAGSLTTSGGRTDQGTYPFLVTTGSNTIDLKSNVSVSTMVIYSASDATVSGVDVELPKGPALKQQIKIVSLPIITTANIYGGAGVSVRNVPADKFSGNTGITLTYMGSGLGWLLS